MKNKNNHAAKYIIVEDYIGEGKAYRFAYFVAREGGKRFARFSRLESAKAQYPSATVVRVR
jgi:hypothetical protein